MTWRWRDDLARLSDGDATGGERSFLEAVLEELHVDGQERPPTVADLLLLIRAAVARAEAEGAEAIAKAADRRFGVRPLVPPMDPRSLARWESVLAAVAERPALLRALWRHVGHLADTDAFHAIIALCYEVAKVRGEELDPETDEVVPRVRLVD